MEKLAKDSKGLRILFVSNLFPDSAEPYRGLDNATVLHALRQYHDCEIRVLSPRPCLPFAPFAQRSPRSEDALLLPAYVPARYIPKIGSGLNHQLMRRAIGGPLREIRRKFSWDVMLVSWLYPDGWAAVKVAQLAGMGPVVLIAQGSDVHRYLNIPARRRCILKAVGGSAGVITRSRSLATLLAGAGANSSTLFPITNGINSSTFTSGDREEARRGLGISTAAKLLLYVGNFLEVKNPLLLVRAFSKLCAMLPSEPLQLVMVGKGPLQSAVAAEAAKLGVGDRVMLTGPLLPGEVATWMRAAELFCMTSKNEGLPNVILEAQACGLPVVSTAVGSIEELVDEPWKGGLSSPHDLDGWVREALRLLQAPPERERIAQLGASRTWQLAAGKYHEVLARAAASASFA